ncbi:MAG: DMT family transporter [Candidatus Hodarchaeales archaeon]|jgi:drug/metabolite transporter (DMT)-like permease
MSKSSDESNKVYGPAVVSVANAARAFDAPVRYPLLFSAPGVFDNPYNMSRTSSFVTLVEHLFGVLILLPIILILRGKNRIINILKGFDKRDWISVIFISFGGSALGLFFFLISFGLGNPTIAILLQKSQPLITLIFAWFIIKERPDKAFWIALVIAIFGIALLALPDIIGSSQTFDVNALIAITCSLIAATLWGGSTVFGRILTKNVDYWDLTLFRYVGGFSFLVIFNLLIFAYTPENFNLLTANIQVFGSDGNVLNFGWEWLGIITIMYSAIFTGGIIPLAIYYYGLKRSKASIAGLAELAFPVLAVFVNFIFLGFGLTEIQIVGAIILLADVSILSYINTERSFRQASAS